MTPKPKEIDSLIRLLDDPDPFVSEKVRDRLLLFGAEAIPFLEEAGSVEKPTQRRAAREILAVLKPVLLEDGFRQLAQSGSAGDLDLEAGLGLMLQWRFGVDHADMIRYQLDQLAETLESRISREDSAPEVVTQFSRFLFQEQGFSGNEKTYFDPDNSFFNRVLERKTGIPITLAVLCILLGRRLDLPIHGVGMPCHFIVKYDDRREPVFFDPFHGGRILTREDCVEILHGFGVEFEDRFLVPVSSREILVRMLHNLIHIYQKENETQKSEQLARYSRILMEPGGLIE